jgi:hypothetical protein
MSRRALVALLAAAAVLAAGAAGRPDRPFELDLSTGASGLPLLGSYRDGMGVRFVEHGTFWIETGIRNTSGETITVLDAHTPEPPRSIVRQVGTRLGLTPECTLGPCDLTPRDIDERPLHPVEVPSDAELGIRLHYKLGTCSDVPHATFDSADTLVVDYRDAAGGVQQQTFSLGRLRLMLGRPQGVDCVPRPFSHLGLVGSFTTSPGHLPVPGSDGDTCVRDGSGTLRYTSRYFESREGIRWRVEIVLPRFAGKGTYKSSARVARTGPVDVIVSGSFGSGPGPSVFHGHPGIVTVTQATGRLYGGRLDATLSGKRRFFSAYGAWRCTTRLSSDQP